MIMSYKNKFYLEAELEDDDTELEEDEDIEKGLDEDDDDNYDDENGHDADDDESENDELDTEDPVEEDEPRPMTYDDLDDCDDDTSEDEEDDMSDFGSDDSDINNDYDPKDADALNKLISSEASAVQEYLYANMETSNDNLRRLYVDIANEERFHIEQLMYAKAKLTGEKYEPSDPEVKREYEELCNSGMDEESAMSTACDKCAISRDRDYTNDSINDIINDINDFTESFVESTINNLTLASYENTQDVYMEYADIYMEGIQNVTDRNIRNDNKIHPIRFLVNTFVGIIKFIRRMVKRIIEFLRKIHIKDANKIRWIKKHGISALFKDGIWLYTWSDQGDHRDNLRASIQYIDLMSRVLQTVRDSMYNKKEQPPIQSAVIKDLVAGMEFKPIKYKNIEDGVNVLRNVVFSKEKVIVTESNQEDLEELFFGISLRSTNSNNIYNWLEMLGKSYDNLGKNCEQVLEQLKDLEGNYDSAYGKNPKLYNMLISSTKSISKEITKFSKVISHDVSKVMELNSGLYELMKEHDDINAYNSGKSDEAKEDVKNGNFKRKEPSEDLKKHIASRFTKSSEQ
jgi:spore coat protein CotF